MEELPTEEMEMILLIQLHLQARFMSTVEVVMIILMENSLRILALGHMQMGHLI